jgi:hypothetical protein
MNVLSYAFANLDGLISIDEVAEHFAISEGDRRGIISQGKVKLSVRRSGRQGRQVRALVAIARRDVPFQDADGGQDPEPLHRVDPISQRGKHTSGAGRILSRSSTNAGL